VSLEQGISRAYLEGATTEIRQDFAAKLKWKIELDMQQPRRNRPAGQNPGHVPSLLKTAAALRTYLGHPDLEPTNNTSKGALKGAVIGRNVNLGVQSEWGGQLVARLLTATTCLEQQDRDAMALLMELMNARREKGLLPSLIPQAG
jgi:hypothetical protein